jgi:two-component system, chemotaxis family, protein-glutamate methylesterase/glutaminase
MRKAVRANASRAATAIQVLVVDDSPLMRRLITRLVESDPGIHVIDTAADGFEAVEKTAACRPDVITLDIEMPRLNGLGALRTIMEQTPTPVIMLSALHDADTVMNALQLGAVDFVSKPSGTVSVDLYKMRDEIVHKIKVATFARHARGIERRTTSASAASDPLPEPRQQPLRSGAVLDRIGDPSEHWIIAIGASTGGPKAITELLSALPSDLPGTICIVQHMPAGFTRSFAERLNRISRMSVVEAADGMILKLGSAYVAPGDMHMLLTRKNDQTVVQLERTPPVHSVRPSIDVLMRSTAQIGGARTLGILLTGMGSDGAEGLEAIKLVGGVTMAQDQETSVIFGMPKAAIGRGVVDQVLPLPEIPDALVKALRPRHDNRNAEERPRGV